MVWARHAYRNDRHLAELTGQVVRSGGHCPYFIRSRSRLLLHGLGQECLQERPSLGRVDGAGSEVGTTLSILHTITFSAALAWSGPGMSTGTTVTWPS